MSNGQLIVFKEMAVNNKSKFFVFSSSLSSPSSLIYRQNDHKSNIALCGRNRKWLSTKYNASNQWRNINKWKNVYTSLESEEVGLQVNVNYKEGYIARNSHGKTTGWANEEKFAESPMSIGVDQQFELLILCDVADFKIAINGQHYCSFQHRVTPQSNTYLVVCGDVQIRTIQWEINRPNEMAQMSPQPQVSTYLGPPMPPGYMMAPQGYGMPPPSYAMPPPPGTWYPPGTVPIYPPQPVYVNSQQARAGRIGGGGGVILPAILAGTGGLLLGSLLTSSFNSDGSD